MTNVKNINTVSVLQDKKDYEFKNETICYNHNNYSKIVHYCFNLHTE